MTGVSVAPGGSTQLRAVCGAQLVVLEVAQAAAPPARVLRGAARCASHVAGRQLCIARRRAGRSGGRHR
jgi:hypothetical protein